MSTTDNNSNILRKDASDIFGQIRKKAEDMSTSEGSNRIFQNLSNPTNLTNPQIITLRKINNSDISKTIGLNKVKTRNKSFKYRNEKSTIESTKNELHEKLLINEQIKKLILRKKQRLIFDQNSESQRSNNKHFFNLTQKKNLEQKFKKNRTIQAIGEEDKDLWSKIKGDKNNKNKRNTPRINKMKFITARDYISTSKNISLLKFIRKNKIEKLNLLVNIQKSELNILNKNMESLENNKEAIITNYKHKYVTYINYLLKQKDSEEKKNIDLIIESSKIRKEIKQIQSKINKVQKEKTDKLNLILLLIQIKERIRILPENAFQLFDNFDNKKKVNNNNKNNQKIINRKSILKKKISSNKFKENITINEDMKKVLKYKEKNIYDDIYEFDYDFNQMEEKIRKKIKHYENIKKDIKEFKIQLEQVKAESNYDPSEGKRIRLNNMLNDLLFKNKELKSELNSIKIKYNIASGKIPFKSRNVSKPHDLKIRKSSSTKNFFQTSTTTQTYKTKTNQFFFNNIITINEDTIYSPKTILSFKQYFNLENFDFCGVSNLFLSCYNLYYLTKENLFQENDIKSFDINIKRGFSSEPEKATILKMIEYIDTIVTLLLKQKKMYLENKYLRKKYERMRDLLEEEKRRMKIFNSFKKDEEKSKLKIKQLSMKKDKVRFIPFHKVENKYFFRTQKEQITKANNLAELKRAPTFEDFMFDIMV